MTDMANYFYYRGKFDLKLLIFRLKITYLRTLRMAPYCTVLIKKNLHHPSMNLNPHHYRIYLCVRYVIFAVKNVKPQFFTFLWLLRAIKILNIEIEIAPRSSL